MSNSQTKTLPKEVVSLERSFLSVPGITSANVRRSKHAFSSEEIKQLNSLYFVGEFADFPIAMLRRSNGKMPDEVLVYIEFEIARDESGLKALEFLSWWARDLSRSGDNVQIRSIGLPPIAGENVQLGHTLRFWFEIFIVSDQNNPRLLLDKISQFAENLDSSIELYKSAF